MNNETSRLITNQLSDKVSEMISENRYKSSETYLKKLAMVIKVLS